MTGAPDCNELGRPHIYVKGSWMPEDMCLSCGARL